jgi:tetratricopeptide (TPR) repeat protein
MRKNIIIGIAVLLIASLSAAGFWFYKHKPAIKSLPNKQRNLTADQQKIYTDKIKKAEDYLGSLNKNKPGFLQEQSNVYIYLGQQYYGLGQLQKSEDMYNLVLKSDPKNEQALVGLSLIFSDAGDLDGTRRVIKTALDSNPNNPDIWLRYIELSQTGGSTKQEISDLFSQALEKTGNAIDILTRDAEFQEQNGNIAQAIVLWKEAAKKYPDNASVYEQEIHRLEKIVNK